MIAALGDAPDGYERAEESLRVMAWHARDAATAQHDALRRIHKIARHGTGDWRDMDRRIAEGKCGFSGPTMGEVRAAQKVLAARGDDAATVEQWDANPWLLNTPHGVVDLGTGSTRPHRPTDYQTRITAVSAGGECATWRRFPTDVTGGDAELQAFLQRSGDR